MVDEALLSVRGISKMYPGTLALDGVDLDIRGGEIHALVGGNGCGKSTLIKILSGVVEADAGEMHIAGHTVEAARIHPRRAYDLGIRVVHQDLAVFPDLSVAENLRLGTDYPATGFGQVRWHELRRGARDAIQKLDIAARPHDLIRDLPVAVRAQIAAARAMRGMDGRNGIIILDEPTASLPRHEVHVLFRAVRRMASEGHAVLFVSHRLDEVLELTQRVTVMRDGRVVSEHSTASLTEQDLIGSILGERSIPERAERVVVGGRSTERDLRPPVLKISDLNAGPLRHVNLELRAGEVVGVAGLLGSGRTELLRALYGDLRKSSGRVELNGRRVAFRDPGQAIAAGVIMVPEDRVNAGIFPDLTVDENMSISVLRKYWRGGWFRRAAIQRDAGVLRKRFRVKTPSGDVAIRSLSGGNQQKVVMGRWLRLDPALLLLDEPTQGVDVGARADIYAAVREATHGGSAALIVTSDLEELAQVVDRAVVLHEGRIVAEVPASELSAQGLNELIYQRGEESHVV
ncbi:sugar ABC transporter ATP-binding protein [Arthrobacter sp. S39]|uniref:sugar ABC transporter ATP-binding protein n=1 Tax=Arthrobacter sp. S39 TaxID=2509720 RepID=UPI0010380421|nr:sugar ABC transporter ATP-binding protein [Arthrobacter sp. S39]TAP39148.1 sugar ABC transporter ATP-binding protein [Arthrobacter sp. S39]